MDTAMDSFRLESLKQLRELKGTDIVLFDNKPIKENITIVLRPDSSTMATILNIINEIKIVDPNQYYYSEENIHLTILGNLSANISPEKITKACEKNISKHEIKFRLLGLGSNKHAASVNAYPLFPLYELRSKLRSILHDSGDDYTIHLPIYEHIGWFNIMRYNHIPQQNLLSKLYSYKDTEFGTVNVGSIEVYKNISKILDVNSRILLSEFKI